MELTEITDVCESRLMAAIAPRKMVKYFGIDFDSGSISLKGTNIVFEGRDIETHLKSCVTCALFAVTLGHETDMLIKRAQLESMVEAVTLDRLANDAVTRLSNDVLKQLESENLFTTNILSAGCGDFNLKYQSGILDVLDAYKRCGIAATESGTLLPIKSMTGVVGIARAKVEGMPRGCANCGFVNCRYQEMFREENI